MIAIARVLKAWRETDSALRSCLPDGSGYTVRLATETEEEHQARVRGELTLSVGASETRALVPFRLEETVLCSEPQDVEVLCRALEGLNGRAFLSHPDARINVHRLVAMRATLSPGMTAEVTFQWEGAASWR
jgi:hypothetical protein